MQTFLPFQDYDRSAAALDTVRLRCQIKEGAQVMQSLATQRGWIHHPAVKMWAGYEMSLLTYIDACAFALMERVQETHASHALAYDWFDEGQFDTVHEYPWWWGIGKFHLSHQANMRRKDSKFYSAMAVTWASPAIGGYEYLWPIAKIDHLSGVFQVGTKVSGFPNLRVYRNGTVEDVHADAS